MDFEAFWIGRNYLSLQGLQSRIGEPSTMERFRLWYMKSCQPSSWSTNQPNFRSVRSAISIKQLGVLSTAKLY